MDGMGIGEAVAKTHFQFKVRMGGETKNKRVTPKKHHPRQKDPYGNGDGDLFLKKKHHLDFVNVFPDMLLFFPGMLLFLSNFMFHPPANGW